MNFQKILQWADLEKIGFDSGFGVFYTYNCDELGCVISIAKLRHEYFSFHSVLPKVAWSRQSGVFGPPCGAIKFEVAWTRQSSKMWRLLMIWLKMSDLWRLQLKLWRLLPKSRQFLIFGEKNAILKILSWPKLWRLWPKMWLLFKVFLVAWFLAWFGKLVAFFKFRPLATLVIVFQILRKKYV